MNNWNREVNESVSMRSYIKSALQIFITPLWQTADLNLISFMNKTFQFQQTLTKSIPFYSLQILLELAFNLSFKFSRFYLSTANTATSLWTFLTFITMTLTCSCEMSKSSLWTIFWLTFDWFYFIVFLCQFILHQ